MSEKRLITATQYCLITFNTTHTALQAEKILEDSELPFLIVPTLREISAGCGLSVRFFCDDLEAVLGTLREKGISTKEAYRVIKGASGNQVTPLPGSNN